MSRRAWSTVTGTSSASLTSPTASPTAPSAHRSHREHRKPKEKEHKERKDHKEKHRSRRHNRPPEDTLQVYLDEQRKLFEHLERRHEKFNEQWRQQYNTAKAGKQAAKNRQAKQNLVQSGELKKAKKPTAQAQAQTQVHSQTQPAKPKSRSANSQTAQANKENRTPPPIPPRPSKSNSPKPAATMIGPLTSAAARSSTSVARQALPAAAGSSSSRSFSSTSSRAARASKKPPVNPDALTTFEAARVLRALETPNPSAAYSLTINTRYSKSSLPLRGRVSLPLDCRKAPEKILVFAEPESASAQAALEAGANTVGGEELFPRILAGEVLPTKCLSTPGMLPAVQKSLARFLGPKGLMPAAKRGGVGEGAELAQKVREAGGLMEWKADKLGVVRAPVARMHFALPAVEANVRAMVQAVREGSIAAASSETNTASKSKRVSGITSVRLESTQGPSIELNDVV